MALIPCDSLPWTKSCFFILFDMQTREKYESYADVNWIDIWMIKHVMSASTNTNDKTNGQMTKLVEIRSYSNF